MKVKHHSGRNIRIVYTLIRITNVPYISVQSATFSTLFSELLGQGLCTALAVKGERSRPIPLGCRLPDCCFTMFLSSLAARINYVYLFEMDPRAVSSPLEVFNNVAAETVIYLANLLMYYKV